MVPRDNKFATENAWYPPPPELLSINFLLLEIFWSTAQNGSPTKLFATARQKIFNRRSWRNPSYHKFFQYPKLVKHSRVHYKTFQHYETINFWWKNLDTPPPPQLLSINVFANGTFLQYSREWSPEEIFRY